jgi:cold shock CspA family protein/ribosome-associated translation inhibitor RaiA
MPVSLQITFRDMPPSPAVQARIRELADKLDHFHERIMSCRVVVRAPHRHHHKGRLYHVSIDLKVPGHEIAVNRDPPEHHAHEDIYVAVRDAFDALARRLEDVARERRGDVKMHRSEPHGQIARLFPDEGYGFIETAIEGDVYFHANSVANKGFQHLKVGCEVRYSAEPGEKGLQATVVKPVGKHHTAP